MDVVTRKKAEASSRCFFTSRPIYSEVGVNYCNNPNLHHTRTLEIPDFRQPTGPVCDLSHEES